MFSVAKKTVIPILTLNSEQPLEESSLENLGYGSKDECYGQEDFDALNLEMAKQHNNVRMLHGANALTIDASLAKEAQIKVEQFVQLAQTDQSQCGSCAFVDYQSRISRIAEGVSNTWYAEGSNYDFASGEFPKSEAFGNMLWKNHSAMGCGIAKVNILNKQHLWVACQYAEKGDGSVVENLQSPPKLEACEAMVQLHGRTKSTKCDDTAKQVLQQANVEAARIKQEAHGILAEAKRDANQLMNAAERDSKKLATKALTGRLNKKQLNDLCAKGRF